ncbi:MAG: hypothetical protein ABW174_03810 [Flavitalea sp.]
MKKLLAAAFVACLGFVACDTPSPATSTPEDSTSTRSMPMPDSAKMSDTMGRDTMAKDTVRRDSMR